jgi:hypothetical protein
MLRGATSEVTANNNTFDINNGFGGNDNAIIPYHTHTMPSSGAHSHAIAKGGPNDYDVGGINNHSNNWGEFTLPLSGTNGAHTHTINYVGTEGNTINANIPKYKSVYIWERTA